MCLCFIIFACLMFWNELVGRGCYLVIIGPCLPFTQYTFQYHGEWIKGKKKNNIPARLKLRCFWSSNFIRSIASPLPANIVVIMSRASERRKARWVLDDEDVESIRPNFTAIMFLPSFVYVRCVQPETRIAELVTNKNQWDNWINVYIVAN